MLGADIFYNYLGVNYYVYWQYIVGQFNYACIVHD